MSGNRVPYQLRTNKFVERQLFLDVLDFVRVCNGQSEYVYISMGGPFLEDFKQINDRFAIESMVSLESDEQTWMRQKFNTPYGFIKCLNETSGEFITNFDAFAGEHDNKRFIIWLDYADANGRHEQLQEYQSLITKLTEGDVIKITLNANYQSLLKRSEYTNLNEVRFERMLISEYTEQLSEYVPLGGIQRDHLNENGFAKLLTQSIRIAALKATENSEFVPLPLLGIRYKDSEHQMLTLTIIICSEKLVSMIENDAGYQGWPFRSTDWNSVFEVNVPHLSNKERLTINHLMKDKNDAKAIQDELGFQFDDKYGQSMKLLTSYMKHYRQYPSFGRVM
tara:strand:+ start:2194 stop:3204 length:1011 start_codon:yes stop_codon:yes gene_type:complete